MIHKDHILEQIERFLERLVAARRLLKQNRPTEAADKLEELLPELELAWDTSDEDVRRALRRVLAEVHGDLGLLSGSLGDIDESVKHLTEGLRVLEPVADQDDANFEIFATLKLNAGAIHAASRQFDRAIEMLTSTVDRIEARVGREVLSKRFTPIRLSALQNRGTANEQAGQLAAAEADFRQARQTAQALVAVGMVSALEHAVDLSLSLAGLLARSSRMEEALEEARVAVEAAETMIHEEVGAYAAVFVRAKLLAGELCFATGQLEEGEEHVFEAIDSVPDFLDSVLVGIDQYAELLGLDDEVLERGGLPRDEVEDSYAELLAKLEFRCDDELVLRLVRARYDLVVNDRLESAQDLCRDEPPPEADSRVHALWSRLEKDLRRVSLH